MLKMAFPGKIRVNADPHEGTLVITTGDRTVRIDIPEGEVIRIEARDEIRADGDWQTTVTKDPDYLGLDMYAALLPNPPFSQWLILYDDRGIWSREIERPRGLERPFHPV